MSIRAVKYDKNSTFYADQVVNIMQFNIYNLCASLFDSFSVRQFFVGWRSAGKNPCNVESKMTRLCDECFETKKFCL